MTKGGQQHITVLLNHAGGHMDGRRVGQGVLTQVTMSYITKSIGALTPGSLNGSYCPGPGPPLP